jgi:sugar O-acyltransferase (sialic acid O-acetyltransferase NeuD family)
MSGVITAPAVTANEDTLILSQWYKDDGEFVKKGDILCGVETTKATVDVEAAMDGFLSRLAAEGSEVRVGAPIAALTDSEGEDVQALIGDDSNAKKTRRWTKKAAIVAKRLGIDIENLAEKANGETVTEKDVLAAQEKPAKAKPKTKPLKKSAPATVTGSVDDIHEGPFPANRPERLLLLGGGAGAGAMTVDVLSRTHRQRAVGILDGNDATHGRTVSGVPVIGSLDLIEELWGEGAFDAAILLFTQDLDERAEIFNSLKAKGIRFGNVIDPTVEIRGGAVFGEGNLVMANAFFSTAVTVGDNCFFASHTVIEHHSKIGNHCAFGPRTTTSGAVTIGDKVKTGMGVSIEPYLTIGENTLIASGCVITGDIPANSLVKAHQTHSVQDRKPK